MDQDLERWKEKIPPHWEVKKLEQLLDYVIGGDWGKDESYDDENYDFALCIRGTEIKYWNESRGQTAALRKIKKSNLEKRKLQLNDIILEISGGGPEQPVGRTVVIDNSVLSFKPEIPKICTNFFRLIRPSQEVAASYLNYFLTFFYKTGAITKFQAGSNNLRNLKFPDYIQIPIPLPPLAEQQTIVAKIEELFSELEKGKEQLETALAQLKVYRQSLLQAAFTGKLTNPDVKDGELPEGWKWVKLGDVIEGTPQNGIYKPSSEYGSGVPILRIDGFYDGSIVDNYEYKKLKISDSELLKYQLSVDDIVVNRVNSMSHLGKCGLVKTLQEPTVFESNIMKLQVNLNIALPNYLSTYLSSKTGLSELTKNAKHAVNQASINQKDVCNASVPLCSIRDQKEIVQILESNLTVCDKIEETIKQSLAQAEVLRQSILKQAFEGKLVEPILQKDQKQ